MKREVKGKIINISMTEGMYKTLQEMVEHFNISAAEIVRRGLEVQKEIMLRQKFGYKGEVLARHKLGKEAKAQKRQDAIDMIRKMNPEELTSYIEGLGYFKSYEPDANVRDVIESSEAAGMPIWIQYRINPDGSVMSKREIFNLDELINDLKKNKFI